MNVSFDPGVTIAIITLVAGFTLFSYLKSKHIERIQEIEQGFHPHPSSKNHFDIKFGCLFIGVGLGILIAYVLTEVFPFLDNPLYPACIFLFGGIGLLCSYFFSNKIENQ